MTRYPSDRIPAMRLHRRTGLAVVTLSSPNGTRRDYYLTPTEPEPSPAVAR
jgi:hypothetical protein